MASTTLVEQRTPQRVQLSRARGWRKPAAVSVVSRPSMFGNPFHLDREVCSAHNPCWRVSGPRRLLVKHLPSKAEAAALAVELFASRCGPGGPDEIRGSTLAAVASLRGLDLACWCPLVDDEGHRFPCHADVLLEWANCG